MKKLQHKLLACVGAFAVAVGTLGFTPTYASTMVPYQVAAAETVSVPGTPNLSHDNYGGEGEFNLEATLWSNATATKATFYQDGKVIAEKPLTPSQTGSQNVKIKVSPIYNGTYTYYVEYSNEAGTSRSKEITVKVIKGKLPPAPDRTEPNTNGKRIVMYYPEWGIYAGHNAWMPKDIPWDYITHMNYAFFTIQGISKTIGTQVGQNEVKIFDEFAATEANAGTNEPWGSEYVGTLGAIRKAKREYPHVRMMMSIGGWSQSANFVEASATPGARKAFVDSAIELMRKYKFDGIDIDWEYPTFVRPPDVNDNPNDQGNPRANEADKHNFTLLMQALREGLDKAGAEDGVYYELSAAVGCGIDKMQQTEVSEYSKYLDFINLMTYDMHGAWESFTGHQSPMYARTGEENPYDEVVTQYTVSKSVENFLAEGVPADKLVVGVAYYTRGWGGVEPDEIIEGLPGLHGAAKLNSTGSYAPSTKGIFDGGVFAGNNPYYYVVETLEKDPAFTKYWDPVAQVPYLYSASKKEFYTYDDPQSIDIKLDYINENQLGGAIIWEATCERVGDPVLTKQIYNAFAGDVKPVVKQPTLKVDKETTKIDEVYNVTVTIPASSNATSYEVRENNTVIKQGSVTQESQIVDIPVSKKEIGKYTYVATLIGESGRKDSTPVNVTVAAEEVVKAPTLTATEVVEGKYSVIITIPENSNAIKYLLYENGEQIAVETADPVKGATITKEFSNKAPGQYIYKVELQGNNAIAESNAITVVIPQGEEVVKAPVLAISQVVDGKYTVTLTIPAESNAINYCLYENGEQIKMDAADPVKAETITFDFTNKPAGEYSYTAELRGQSVIAQSNSVSVKIAGEAEVVKPAVIEASKVVDGKYSITINIAENSNAVNYFLYENGLEVKTGTVDPVKAEKFVVDFANKAVGTYEYQVELRGQEAIAASNKVGVVVEEVVPEPEKPAVAKLSATDPVEGSYDVIGEIPVNHHATNYKLYEGSTVIKEGALTSEAAQTIKASLTNKEAGTYSYQLELINTVGTATSNTVSVTVEEVVVPGNKPATPAISHNNWDGKADYTISFNMWWGENGTSWKLYEDDEVIYTGTLTANGQSAQSGSYDVKGASVGTHKYYVELINDVGATASNTIEVTVKDTSNEGEGDNGNTPAPSNKPAAPAVEHDNWNNLPNYTISFNMWWGENGTSWKLYENDELVYTGTLTANGQSGQSGSYNFENKPAGQYTYKVELINEAGATTSNEVNVTVK